jgi:hypothetical protein
MRAFIAIILSSTLLASAALAEQAAPLAPGKPAGVKQAQVSTTTWALLGIAAVTAIAVGVAAGSNGSPTSGPNNIAVTTTTI